MHLSEVTFFLAQNLVKELPFLTAQNSGTGMAQCGGWGAVRYINTQTNKKTNVATYRQDWPRGQLSGNLNKYISSCFNCLSLG